MSISRLSENTTFIVGLCLECFASIMNFLYSEQFEIYHLLHIIHCGTKRGLPRSWILSLWFKQSERFLRTPVYSTTSESIENECSLCVIVVTACRIVRCSLYLTLPGIALPEANSRLVACIQPFSVVFSLFVVAVALNKRSIGSNQWRPLGPLFLMISIWICSWHQH